MGSRKNEAGQHSSPAEAPLKASTDPRSAARFFKFGTSLGSASSRRKKMLRTSTTAVGSDNEEKTLADLFNLSKYQEQLLVQSWPKMYSGNANSNAHAIFTDLCAKNQNAKGFFQKVKTAMIVGSFRQKAPDLKREHGRLVMELLDVVVKSLGNPATEVLDLVRDYGVAHASLKSEGLNNACWDALSDSMLDYVRKHEAVRKHRDLSRAWMQIISLLMDKMKEGQQIGISALNSGYPLKSISLNHKRHSSVEGSISNSSPQISPRSQSIPQQQSPVRTLSRSDPVSEEAKPVFEDEMSGLAIRNQPTRGASFSRPATLADTLGLTAYQLSLLQSTWPKIISGSGVNIGGNILRDVVSGSGAIQAIFQKYTIMEGFSGADGPASRRDHGRFITEMLNFAVGALDKGADEFFGKCAEIAEAHSNLRSEGMTVSEWDTVADVTLAHLQRNELIRKSRDLTRAWMMIITVIIDKIR